MHSSQLSKEAADFKTAQQWHRRWPRKQSEHKKVRENETTRRLEFNREQNMVSATLNDAKWGKQRKAGHSKNYCRSFEPDKTSNTNKKHKEAQMMKAQGAEKRCSKTSEDEARFNLDRSVSVDLCTSGFFSYRDSQSKSWTREYARRNELRRSTMS